jgi:hypothetical protein
MPPTSGLLWTRLICLEYGPLGEFCDKDDGFLRHMNLLTQSMCWIVGVDKAPVTDRMNHFIAISLGKQRLGRYVRQWCHTKATRAYLKYKNDSSWDITRLYPFYTWLLSVTFPMQLHVLYTYVSLPVPLAYAFKNKSSWSIVDKCCLLIGLAFYFIPLYYNFTSCWLIEKYSSEVGQIHETRGL